MNPLDREWWSGVSSGRRGIASLLMLALLLASCRVGQSKRDPVSMVRIPAGEFQMGSNAGEPDERPVRALYLDAFLIDLHEVTNGQYQCFVDATDRPYAQGQVALSGDYEQLPAVWVTWEDARAYCAWVGKRLPTEAEWEKAARGGLDEGRFPWGDEAPDAEGVYRVNYAPNPPDSDGYPVAAPVQQFPPNGYGLYDMAGNVWEWCADWYDRNAYSRLPDRNPRGPDEGSTRVMRGGGWDSDANSLRAAYRGANQPFARSASIGFRCARDP